MDQFNLSTSGKPPPVPLVPRVSEPSIEPSEPTEVHLLDFAGVRFILCIDDTLVLFLWADTDGPEIRSRLKALGLAHCLIAYLDDIPPGFRKRRCPRRGVNESFSEWLGRAQIFRALAISRLRNAPSKPSKKVKKQHGSRNRNPHLGSEIVRVEPVATRDGV